MHDLTKQSLIQIGTIRYDLFIFKIIIKYVYCAHLNFSGLAIGNGLSDPENQLLYSSYLYQLGLIDDSGRTQFENAEKVTKDHIEKYKIQHTTTKNFFEN